MSAESMQEKAVLVFLRPVSPQREVFIHAWQVLTTSSGVTGSFEYAPMIATNVFSRRNPPYYILSDTVKVQPGSLLQAVNSDGLSPKLVMAPDNLAREKLTPQQTGVINNTSPCIELDCNWLVNGRLAATIPNLGEGVACTFEYEPILYFMVARPPLVGQTYNIQDFANMTGYPIPTTATDVYVGISSDEEGRWGFTFSEKI